MTVKRPKPKVIASPELAGQIKKTGATAPISDEVLERAIAAYKAGQSATEAARLAGIGRDTLIRRLDKLGVPRHTSDRSLISLNPELADRIVEAYRNGEGSIRVLAERFNVGRGSIGHLLVDRGISRRKTNTADPAVVDKAVAAFQSGMAIPEAAKLAGVTGVTLKRWLDERGIPRERPRRPPRRRQPLDDETADRIVAAYRQGKSAQELAETFEISEQKLYQLLDGRGVSRQRNRHAARTEVTEEMRDRIAKAYQDGISIDAVAKQFHVGTRKVRAVLDERRVSRRRRRS